MANSDSSFWKRNGFELLKSILDSTAEGVLIEADEKVVYANTRYAELLGYRHPEELYGRSIADLIAAGDALRLREFGRQRIRGENAPPVYDFEARQRDGRPVRLRASVSVAMVGRSRCITTMVQPFYSPGAISEQEQSPLDGPHHRLSQREREVMERILDGVRIKQIALDLRLSEKTIATHRARLLHKLGLAGNRELFQYALRHRLIDWS